MLAYSFGSPISGYYYKEKIVWMEECYMQIEPSKGHALKDI